MSQDDKPLVWLHGMVATPPFSSEARVEAGFLLRMLQKGASLSMPQSRPMPGIGANCHELRINDRNHNWRIVYAVTHSSIVILEVFEKKTEKTPKEMIDICKERLNIYRRLIDE